MLSKKIITFSIIAISGCFLFFGCAQTTAPKGWLVGVDETVQSSRGAWAAVYYSPDWKPRASGELIAINQDSLFVLQGKELLGFPRKDISRLCLNLYRSDNSAIGTWTILGTLSTASHGVWAILSAPAWIIYGSIVGSSASHHPIVHFKLDKGDAKSIEAKWTKIMKFARFPAGMPPDLDRSLISPVTMTKPGFYQKQKKPKAETEPKPKKRRRRH